MGQSLEWFWKFWLSPEKEALGPSKEVGMVWLPLAKGLKSSTVVTTGQMGSIMQDHSSGTMGLGTQSVEATAAIAAVNVG